MEKRLLEERVIALERELAALKLSIDEQPARDAWMTEIEAETPQKVFKLLVMYLAVSVPGFSVPELKGLVESVLLRMPSAMPDQEHVLDHVLRRTKAIISEMLPEDHD